MNEFLKMLAEKLSTYRFFNFIIPGAVFLGFLKFHEVVIIFDENIWWFLLASYFSGIVISRFGSVVVEGLMKKLKVLKDYDVKKYITKQRDSMLVGTMLELANTYRTFCALGVIIFVFTVITFPCERRTAYYVVIELGFVILFLYSFHKQYKYFEDSMKD